VKTAISIPTPLFELAERRARRLGVSRSKLYAQALEQFLEADSDAEITARLNEICSAQNSRLDEWTIEAARRTFARERW